ncbi:histidine phosphatase family protein [Mangrovihabitans endophyticus]|uniref:phosphoglycerate mutase (2,3-diphosphoglycerate-dependent) n=1 Tax=Mangrovihabitans endophyticus TaxID=1751298 RepID=A0A8J3FKK3_9ACTN|nr:histidine phosphatase family protein [Mangrovihabitans endophyticus]GGK71675.1 phosphoglycerate mutase [Mangrovihabitans endophyticus]
MDVVAELVLVRHGQSAANVAFPRADAAGREESGLTGRDTDVPLTDVGVRQAEAVGRWLATLPGERLPQVAVTSPYVRARETWRIAAEASGRELPPPSTDDRLVDRLLGELEMLTRAAIRRRYPDEAARRSEAGEFDYRPPGGESFTDISRRLTSFLDDLNREHAGQRVVVVAHDAVVLMTRFVIEQLAWDDVMRITASGGVRNASLTRFDGSSGTLVLQEYNTVDHLP